MKNEVDFRAPHLTYNTHDVCGVHLGVWGDFIGVSGKVNGLSGDVTKVTGCATGIVLNCTGRKGDLKELAAGSAKI